MSKLTNGVPDFFYKPAAFDYTAIPKIQKEAMKLFLEMQKRTLKNKIFYAIMDFEKTVGKIETYCPVLSNELKRLGLFDYFYSILFIQKLSSQNLMPVHRDADLDTPYVYGHISLNIPITGCENSYTVFYDGELEQKNTSDIESGPDAQSLGFDPWYGTYEASLGGKFANQDTAVEVDRVRSDIPLWINTYAFHAGVTETPKSRLLLSLRFYNLNTLFESGYFDEVLVAKDTLL